MDWVGNFQNSGRFPDYLNPAPRPNPQPVPMTIDLTGDPELIDLTSDTETCSEFGGKYSDAVRKYKIGAKLMRLVKKRNDVIDSTWSRESKVLDPYEDKKCQNGYERTDKTHLQIWKVLPSLGPKWRSLPRDEFVSLVESYGVDRITACECYEIREDVKRVYYDFQ